MYLELRRQLPAILLMRTLSYIHRLKIFARADNMSVIVLNRSTGGGAWDKIAKFILACAGSSAKSAPVRSLTVSSF